MGVAQCKNRLYNKITKLYHPFVCESVCLYEGMNGRTYVHTYGRTDGRTDGRAKRIGLLTDGRTFFLKKNYVHLKKVYLCLNLTNN